MIDAKPGSIEDLLNAWDAVPDGTCLTGNMALVWLADHLAPAFARAREAQLNRRADDPRSVALNEHAERWEKLRTMFGLDGWHDGVFHGHGTVDQIVTHIEHVANERARLLVENVRLQGELNEWRENALELLKDDTDVVRMHEGGGPESLVGSLAITMIKTRKQRDEWLRKGRESLTEIVRLQNTIASKNMLLVKGGEALNSLADVCDKWAEENQTGGWSTHHVKANHTAADAARRSASALVQGATLP